MKKMITLAMAGIFLLGLQSARAQREVPPPAIPPMLEGSRPLATPESSKEPVAPKRVVEEKAKPKPKAKSKQSKTKVKGKDASKAKTKVAAKKTDNQKKATKVAKKKSSKAATKTKRPAAKPAAPKGPDEG